MRMRRSRLRSRDAPPSVRSRRQRPFATGDLTPPPAAFTYRAQRSEAARSTGRGARPQPPDNAAAPRPGEPLRHFGLQRFGLIILFLAIIVSLVKVLTLSADARIMPLGNGSRALLQPSTVYAQAAARDLRGSVWNRNKITIDTNGLRRQLLKQFPELADVSVTVPLLANRPVVYVQPAQPALVLATDNGSFLVDDAGKAILSADSPTALDQPNLPVVTDQSGLNVQLSRQALAATSVSFIRTVVGELAAKQFTVAGMTLPAGSSELDVHLSGQPYFVKFNLESNNARGEAGTFLATISQLRRQNVTPGQYVDVRVDGRAYYK